MEITKIIKHKFPYNWNLKDGYPAKGIKPNNLNVFGTFICGGGSTMGYKLAGFNDLGGVEIDPKVANVYKENHKPKYLYIEDIREFVKRKDLPKELYNLDILDGSPPCSSFSMTGNREKDWGKQKVFKEGQSKQILDNLFFEYIELAKKLQPKVVIAENVRVLINGNAKSYVHKIKKGFEDAGFKVQLFLLNAATMGVPQKRERVFFICQRKDLKMQDLKFNFNEPSINIGSLQCKIIGKPISNYDIENYYQYKISTDKGLDDINIRINGKQGRFGSYLLNDCDVCNTIVSADGNKYYLHKSPHCLSKEAIIQIGSFPTNYNFGKINEQYLIGMSVPPVMTAQIAHQIYLQWFIKLKTNA